MIYTWNVHVTEKFQYPVNVILKRGKELVKKVLVTVFRGALRPQKP